MESNFDECLKYVLIDEGGNDDDPADHGGRTSRGITQREYDAWRSERGQTRRDVWTADDSEIRAIYHDEYWLPLCPSLPGAVDYIYFDLAVNGGPHRAAITLQRALGVTADGRIGPITRSAITVADPIKLVVNFSNEKRAFYESLHQPRFLKGWLNRTASVQMRATTMVSEIA